MVNNKQNTSTTPQKAATKTPSTRSATAKATTNTLPKTPTKNTNVSTTPSPKSKTPPKDSNTTSKTPSKTQAKSTNVDTTQQQIVLATTTTTKATTTPKKSNKRTIEELDEDQGPDIYTNFQTLLDTAEGERLAVSDDEEEIQGDFEEEIAEVEGVEDEEDAANSGGGRSLWSLDDNLTLVEAVDQYGKGTWERVKEHCHDKHKCTQHTDADKFRTHFNTINNKRSSSFFKPYKRPKYPPKELKEVLKGLSKEMKLQKEKEWSKMQDHLEKQHQQVQALLEVISNREKLESTKTKKTVQEASAFLTAQGKECCKESDVKLEAYESQAKEEKAYREILTTSTQHLNQILEQQVKNEQRMWDVMEKLFALEGKKLEVMMLQLQQKGGSVSSDM